MLEIIFGCSSTLFFEAGSPSQTPNSQIRLVSLARFLWNSLHRLELQPAATPGTWHSCGSRDLNFGPLDCQQSR